MFNGLSAVRGLSRGWLSRWQGTVFTNRNGARVACRGMLTHIHLRSSTYCALYGPVSVYIKERSVIIIQWHDYLRVWRLRFVTACAMRHTYPSRYSKPSLRSPMTVGMDRYGFSGTDNDGCGGPVNTLSSLVID